MSDKMSPLVIWEILELFVNTLTADDKYSLRNIENLWQPIQIQLSQRQKKFSQFFAAFLKLTSNFEQFEKEDDPHSLCMLETKNCKRRG